MKRGALWPCQQFGSAAREPGAGSAAGLSRRHRASERLGGRGGCSADRGTGSRRACEQHGGEAERGLKEHQTTKELQWD